MSKALLMTMLALIMAGCMTASTTPFTTCIEAPCVYADSNGYAGLRLHDGDIELIGTLYLDVDTNGAVVQVRGLDPLAFERAKWQAIVVTVQGEYRVSCEGSRILSAESIRQLTQVTVADIQNDSMAICQFLRSFSE